jgi:DNA-binding transcriptional MerR regulator
MGQILLCDVTVISRVLTPARYRALCPVAYIFDGAKIIQGLTMGKLDRSLSLSPTVPADQISIGDFARQSGVTLRALRFYQSKGLLAPQREGHSRVFSSVDRERLGLILQGKRLGFTLFEIRDMLAARDRGTANALPISRKKCVEQIKLLEGQRRDAEQALIELRQIYTRMFIASDFPRTAAAPAAQTA